MQKNVYYYFFIIEILSPLLGYFLKKYISFSLVNFRNVVFQFTHALLYQDLDSSDLESTLKLSRKKLHSRHVGGI